MHKTTLYLPEPDVQKLKLLAFSTPKKGLTWHIQRAVKMYLDSITGRNKKRLSLFRKAKGSIKKSPFGDSVLYQKKLRSEWER